MQSSGNAFIAQFWNVLQRDLFPELEEELGPLQEGLRLLAAACCWLRLENFVPRRRHWRGRRPHDRLNLLRAFLAKAALGISQTRQLLQQLKSDPALRRLCGWERAGNIPSEAVFSRAFAELAASQQLQQIQEALVQRIYGGRMVGHVIRDSTAIEAREKVVKTPDQPVEARLRKRGRPRKDEPPRPAPRPRLERQRTMTVPEMLAELPQHCNWGMRINTQGKKQAWRGYKLHWDVSDSEIPLSCLLTSASLHDTQAAIPLATLTAQRVTSLYDLMDAGYDAQQIRAHSASLGHIPVIPRLPRHGHEPEQMHPAQHQRYGLRTLIERLTARLKDEFGGRSIRVRGAAKILTHLLLGVLILTVDQLQKLVT
jgi:hypothetical protein